MGLIKLIAAPIRSLLRFPLFQLGVVFAVILYFQAADDNTLQGKLFDGLDKLTEDSVQLISQLLGGSVRKGDKGEFGLAILDLLDAKNILTLDVQCVFATDDQRRLVARCDSPLSSVGAHQVISRALPVVKAPLPLDNPRQIPRRKLRHRVGQHHGRAG